MGEAWFVQEFAELMSSPKSAQSSQQAPGSGLGHLGPCVSICEVGGLRSEGLFRGWQTFSVKGQLVNRLYGPCRFGRNHATSLLR